MRYQLTPDRGIVYRIDGNGLTSVVTANSGSGAQQQAWEDYMAWLAGGNSPDPSRTLTEIYVLGARDLNEAKTWGTWLLKTQLTNAEATVRDGYSPVQLLAQGALPAEDREPELDAVIQRVNELTAVALAGVRRVREAKAQEEAAAIVEETLLQLQP